MAVALARRGHNVTVKNKCPSAMEKDGVLWSPLDGGIPERCDLYIANRSDKLLFCVREAKQAIFGLHKPAQYLLKFR